MWAITLNIMKKSAKMLVSAGIAVLIGTAFIASTFLFSNSLDESLRKVTAATLGQANYAIGVKDASGGYLMQPISAFKLDRIRAIDGVRSANPLITTVANVSAHGSKSAVKGDGSKTGSSTGVMVVNTSSDAKLLAVFFTEGRQPQGENEVALPSVIAERLGVRIGDTVSIGMNAAVDVQGAVEVGADPAKVVGLTTDPNGAYTFYNGAAVVSDDIMTRLYGLTDNDFSKVETGKVLLNIDPGKATAAQKEIDALLPQGFALKSVKQVADDASKNMSANGLGFTTMFLLSFGVLAMLVASLVIANTFQVLVAQRRRTLALLRTIGAKRGQLYRSVLLEAGVLGAIASILGIAVGIGLMAALIHSGLFDAAGGSMLVSGGLVLSWQVFVVPLVFGILVTVLASIGSARAATSVTPLEALRPLELVDSRRSGKVRAVLGWFAVILGIALVAVSIWQTTVLVNGDTDSSSEQVFGMLLFGAVAGCGLVFLGLVLTATFWMPALMRGVGALVAKIGPSSAIAHANVQKNPRRVAATGAALLIGVTLVSTMATGAAGVKQTLNHALDMRYSVDLVAYGPGLDKSGADSISSIRGIGNALYAPTANAEFSDATGKNHSVMLVGVASAQALQQVLHGDIGSMSVEGKNIVMPERLTYSGKALNLGSGNTALRILDAQREQASSIDMSVKQAQYRGIADTDLTAFVSESLFTSGEIQSTGHMLLTKVNGNEDSLANIFQNVQTAASKLEGVDLTGPVAQRVTFEQIINTMLALLVGLLAVAVFIALIGVANTLSLSVIERTRESATLRAIGMTRGQLRRSLAVEALLISLVSGVVGVVLGTGFGWAGTYMVMSAIVGSDGVSLPMDWDAAALVLIVAAIAALIASVAPARRAVRTAPVEALAEA
ncbi:ABC transporter permease [Bifidobacterium tsurumiense]|uniref:ABC transporter permease n=1 Tax=Bifidobacterium tsurumiense TaxID=356829 RepID=UPI0012B36CAD|nr:ABC transporter permease [Bifidobacterium tsurumiense]MSS12083.1 ABC transporter permease [Bifidobacterium tsurumiense]